MPQIGCLGATRFLLFGRMRPSWNPKDVKVESQPWHLVFSKTCCFTIIMRATAVDASELIKQCEYGLIQEYPVPIAESQQKFKQLLSTKGQKSKNFKPSSIYNVICLHEDCPESSWDSRRNFRSFRGKHWAKKHDAKQNVMFRTRPESRDSKTVKSRALARDFTVLEFSRAPGRVRNVLSRKVFQSASINQGIDTLGYRGGCWIWNINWYANMQTMAAVLDVIFIRMQKETIQTFSELSTAIT